MRRIEPAAQLLGSILALALFITAIWSAVNAPPVPVKAMQAPVEVPDYSTVLKKAYQDQMPRTITTERIAVAPEVIETAPTQTAEATEPEPVRALKPHPKPRTDICRGKGKRYYGRGKAYWRCRR